MTIAYSYTRLSTEKQLKGHGKKRQEEAIAKACQENGWTLSDKGYSDMGVSAWKGRNKTEGALNAFMEAVRNGEVAKGSVLIVENVDRLSREDVDKSVRLMLDLLELEVDIFTLSDNKLYTNTSANKFMDLMVWGMSAQRAHAESEVKSDRVLKAKAANKERMRNGEIVTRKCPAWFKVNADKTAFLEQKKVANVVRSVFQMYSSGMGVKPIAIKLNEANVPYWGKHPEWTGNKVSNLLKNKAVIGICQPLKREGSKDVPDGPPIENYYPPIIERELWDKCQHLKGVKKVFQGNLTTLPMANLFKGLLKCECGSGVAMNSAVVKGKRYSSLRCSHLRTTKCKAPNWTYRHVEQILLMSLGKMDWDHFASKDASLAASLRTKIDALEAKALSLKSDVDNATLAFAKRPESQALESHLVKVEADYMSCVQELEGVKAEQAMLEANREVSSTWTETLRELLFDVDEEDNEEVRYAINALLNKRIKAITFTQPRSYRATEIEAYAAEVFHGRIDVDFGNDKVIQVEVTKKYKRAFVWHSATTYTLINKRGVFKAGQGCQS